MNERSQRERDAYVEAVGKPPARLPDDDPLAWQWDVRLTRRERLARLALLWDEEPPEVPVEPLEGQESLL